MMAVIPPFVYWISRFLFWSCRLTVKNYEEFQADLQAGRVVIGAAWHSRTLILPRLYHWVGYKPIVVLVSQSFDGRLGGAFISRHGFRPVWGSSTRGGEEGMAELIEWGRKGVNVAITPDGPRGPAETVRPGAVRLAAALDAPVYPVVWFCDRATRLRSWDRFIIPHPFARVICQVGRPIHVPKDAAAEVIEAKRKELEDELRRITAEVESYFG